MLACDPREKIPMGGDVGLLIQVPCSVALGMLHSSALVEVGE